MSVVKCTDLLVEILLQAVASLECDGDETTVREKTHCDKPNIMQFMQSAKSYRPLIHAHINYKMTSTMSLTPTLNRKQ